MGADKHRRDCDHPGAGRRSYDPMGLVAGKDETEMIKNLTYRNLMTVFRKIEAKGYDFQESERLAKHIFAEFEARPQGMSIEERVRRVLTKEEWETECRECG